MSASVVRMGSLSEQLLQKRRHASLFTVAHTPTDCMRLCSISIHLLGVLLSAASLCFSDDLVPQTSAHKHKALQKKTRKKPKPSFSLKLGPESKSSRAVFPFIL